MPTAGPTTILVTGSNGFIGRPLTVALQALGHVVHGLDIDPRQPAPGVIQHTLDLESIDALESLMRAQGIAAAVHGGGISGPMVAPDDPYRVARVNVTGSINLIEAARRAGVDRFVYLSSAAAYGPTRTNPVPDDAPLDPDDMYGASKAAFDLLLAAYRRDTGMPAVGLRLANVYGPGRRTACPIGGIISEALAGKPVRLSWGRGYAKPYLHVDDAVSAICSAIGGGLPPRASYNVAGPEYVDTTEVARLVMEAIPGAEISLGEGMPAGGYHRDPLDISNAMKDLGYVPRVTIAEGIAGYVDWMRSGADWYPGPAAGAKAT